MLAPRQHLATPIPKTAKNPAVATSNYSLVHHYLLTFRRYSIISFLCFVIHQIILFYATSIFVFLFATLFLLTLLLFVLINLHLILLFPNNTIKMVSFLLFFCGFV